MSKKILVPIASGTEEMEAITIIDMMVRAGYDVTTASANLDGSLTMAASRGVTLTADCSLAEIDDQSFDAIVLSGGVGGSEIFRDNSKLITMLIEQHRAGRLVAAICAAPALVLAHHKLFSHSAMTCHPGFKSDLNHWNEQRVVLDKMSNLITSQGPGTALEFCIEIIAQLSGTEHAHHVLAPMVAHPAITFNPSDLV
jgi:4-methyl-5(b-hydroxyethyl)-thiazole monophosphate biosynthesis